jgi:hypothetical protein
MPAASASLMPSATATALASSFALPTAWSMRASHFELSKICWAVARGMEPFSSASLLRATTVIRSATEVGTAPASRVNSAATPGATTGAGTAEPGGAEGPALRAGTVTFSSVTAPPVRPLRAAQLFSASARRCKDQSG